MPIGRRFSTCPTESYGIGSTWLLRVQLHQDSPHLRISPAQAAGVVDRLMDVSDLVEMLEAEEWGVYIEAAWVRATAWASADQL